MYWGQALARGQVSHYRRCPRWERKVLDGLPVWVYSIVYELRCPHSHYCRTRPTRGASLQKGVKPLVFAVEVTVSHTTSNITTSFFGALAQNKIVRRPDPVA